jgi:hypothetical protein
MAQKLSKETMISNNRELSPIVLFVYNRIEHTKKTVEALSKNLLADESELFVYSDAAKDVSAIDKVKEVRSYIKTIQGFKSLTIIEREKNWGLAATIIDGVTNVVNQYGKIIVLEDDIVTSSYFLKFMNDALDFYADNIGVWHISGWNHPIKTDGLGDAFFWRTMDCWGWATWKNRWKYFKKDTDKLLGNFTKLDIYRFNMYGADNLWGQVFDNKKGKINTWAIFWYASIFQENGLCLNPTISFVQNIGLDGTGIHCGESSIYVHDILCEKDINFMAIRTKENRRAVKRIKLFYKKQKRTRCLLRIMNKVYTILIRRLIPPPRRLLALDARRFGYVA